MVPTLLHSAQTPRLLFTLASLVSQHVPSISPTDSLRVLKRSVEDHRSVAFIVCACLIPFLVLLSGVFAGLTLGYMSLDETQLNVLSISGTPEQKMYANKIKPIRKDGHLLLVTLLLANMIVNETLPVISDPVLGGGVQSVVVSTVLIVIFSEIIPQSLCTRYGLYFGAKMAGPVRVLIWTLGIVAWPVAKLLEFALGPHHGIIYRRAELKELIAMHSSVGEYGGDLKTDTVTIIGGALDLQEKVVKQAMTPIEDVFMLSLDAKLDYETLRKICLTGHSRVPVFEEVEVPASTLMVQGAGVDSTDVVDGAEANTGERRSFSLPHRKPAPQTIKVKKIVGILLVKQCVLLDPKDATPVRKIPLNKVPFVPNNEPLLGILDRFQDGRSHMAIVSRFSVEQAVSVKKAVKRGLTQRLRHSVGIADSTSSSSSSSDSESDNESGKHSPVFSRKRFSRKPTKDSDSTTNGDTLRGDGEPASDEDPASSSSPKRTRFRVPGRRHKKSRVPDIEMGTVETEQQGQGRTNKDSKLHMGSLSLPRASFGRWEQNMPADAVLTKQGADEFLQTVDPAIMPLGIITLEDVLEELIGEEIYDEFDPQGHPDLKSFAMNETKVPPPVLKRKGSAPELANNNSQALATGAILPRESLKPLTAAPLMKPPTLSALKGLNFKGLAFSRSKSAPPSPVDEKPPILFDNDASLSPAPSDSIIPEYSSISKREPTPLKEMDVAGAAPGYSITEGTFTQPLFDAQPYSISDPPVSLPLSTPQPVKARPADAVIRAPVPVAAIPSVPMQHIVNPALILPVAGPRSGSSSPSFEQAILVERKRRAVSGLSNSPVPKGARFKSSPLTGDRTGVVVAEKVKRGLTTAVNTDDAVDNDAHKLDTTDRKEPDEE